MNVIRIEKLQNHRALIPLVAGWLHREWGAISAYHAPINEVVRLQHHAATDSAPFTLISFWRNLPVGCVSVVFHDNFEQPWLTNLYVDPVYRERSVGTALVQAASLEASKAAFQKLMLVTGDQAAFFARLGWRILATQHFGSTLTIMEKSLLPQTCLEADLLVPQTYPAINTDHHLSPR